MFSGARGLPFTLDPLIAEAKRRMRQRRLLVAALVVAAAGAGWVAATRFPGGPGSGPPPVRGALSGSARVGAIRIDPAGAVGPLQMNRSNRTQVISYAGTPDLDRHSHYTGKYEVLGYGCAANAGTQRYWSKYPVRCRTAFYLVRGRLSLFFTSDPRFAESGGVQIGTTTQQAERLLHRRAISGCTDAIHLDGQATSLTVSLLGPRGRVDAFYLHGRLNPGVTDCD